MQWIGDCVGLTNVVDDMDKRKTCAFARNYTPTTRSCRRYFSQHTIQLPRYYGDGIENNITFFSTSSFPSRSSSNSLSIYLIIFFHLTCLILLFLLICLGPSCFIVPFPLYLTFIFYSIVFLLHHHILPQNVLFSTFSTFILLCTVPYFPHASSSTWHLLIFNSSLLVSFLLCSLFYVLPGASVTKLCAKDKLHK